MSPKERASTFTNYEGHPSCPSLNDLVPSRARAGIERLGVKVHTARDRAQSHKQGKSSDESYLGRSKGENSSLGEWRCHSTLRPIRFSECKDHRL